jgi:gluconokinase
MGLRNVRDVLAQLIPTPGTIRATGGAFGAPVWRSVLADVFARTVEFPRREAGAVLGAAVLGMVAVGVAESIDIVGQLTEVERVQEPDPNNVAVYDRLFEQYLTALSAIEPTFGVIGSSLHEA